MIRSLLRQPATGVWFGLVLVTCLSWWLGSDRGSNDHRLVSVILILLAFTKVRFVGAYFMELRNAPLVLRLIFQGWCVVVCATLIGLYLTGS
jgi:apolipoprotein N-acyltransferase